MAWELSCSAASGILVPWPGSNLCCIARQILNHLLKKIFFNHVYLFLMDWRLLYNIGLISAIHRHELAIPIHMSPPPWTFRPPPTLSHPCRLLQSPGLSSLSHTANSYWLIILHMIVYMLSCYSLHLSHPFSPLPRPHWLFKTISYLLKLFLNSELFGLDLPFFLFTH